MFEITELPFFVLLIITVFPITVAVIIFIRLLELFKRIIAKRKQKETISLITLGELIVYLTIFTAIFNIILYLTGTQPSDFSIDQFLLEEMLPTTWYVILIYGILVEFTVLISRGNR